MASVTLQQVSKRYGKEAEPAVRALDMEIADGEIVSLLGSSGCGKTSTLRMIAGFEEVSSGSIHIGSRCVNDVPPAGRGVAMAFEGYALYPPLSVRDNIAFALLRSRMPRQKVREVVQRVAELLEIGDLLEHHPPTLSGGQQQRVSLARALARPADVCLLDEPMSQLEPQLRALLRARLRDWLRSQGTTAIVVTHDQTEAMALSDRVAVMSHGVLQQFSCPAQLGERPGNRFVASFVGEPAMNLLPAEVEGQTDGDMQLVVRGVDGQGEALRVAWQRVEALCPGQTVHLGIQPHRVLLGAQALAAPAGSARGSARLRLLQWQGDQTHWSLNLGGHRLLAVSDPQPQDAALAPGADVPLALPPDALHAFDSASGQALWHGGH